MLMSFFLSGSETALTAVNKMKVHSRAENDDKKSLKLLKLISKPDQLITSILIGNNIANIMLPTLVTMIAIEYGWNVGVATGILTVVLIVFAEVLPKTIAATFADKIAYIVAPVIRLLIIILKPVTFLISRFTNMVIRLISKGEVQEATLSKEELKTMVDIAYAEGTFRNEETMRIKGAIDFYSMDVRDALKTPRIDMIGIPINSTFEETRNTIMNNRYTRYPIYKGDIDNIVGVFHSKRLLEWSMEPKKKLENFIDKQPLFVVESTAIEKVFKMMLKEKKHLAVVLDEYGGTMGMITHEDIIEAMIGQEIEDETDIEDEVLIYELTDSYMICHGRLLIYRLNEAFKIKLPEDTDILAGFILKELEHIPVEGETFEYHHLHFEILEMDRNKIIKVKIIKKTHS